MIRILSGLRRKPGRGAPFLGLSPGDGGRESLVSCLLLLEAPAIHLAAKRLRRRRGRFGGRTGGPGRLPASVGNTCCPPGREAASAAGGPLQRQDGSPRSAACFYRKCLLSAWPRSDFGGEGAASAAGRGAPVGCLLLLEIPAVRLAAKRLRRREGRCSGRTGTPGQLPASIGSTCCPARRLAALQAGVFSAVSLRLPCGKGAGARRATEGLSAETSPERIIPGQYFSA